MDGHCAKCADPGLERPGTPVGRERKIDLGAEGVVDVYEVGSGEAVIILCTDVFGFKYNNSRLLADDYAERLKNVRVIVPDYLFGNYVDFRVRDREKFVAAFMEWLKTAEPERPVRIVGDLIKHLIHTEKAARIGLIGFCWGAPSVCTALQAEEEAVKAGIIAHPSRSQQFDPNLIKKPLHILAAENDEAFPLELAKKWTTANPDYISRTEYPGCTHGFACRPMNQEEIAQSRKAMEMTVSFFKSHLE